MNAKSRVIDQYALKWNFELQGKKKQTSEDELVEALKGYILMPPPRQLANGRNLEKGADPLSVAAGGANKTQCCSIF
jgi:hypothetical protein